MPCCVGTALHIVNSKHCILTIFATFSALACLEEITRIVGEESTYDKTTLFLHSMVEYLGVK